MGSFASKSARAATSPTIRKYPTRRPPAATRARARASPQATPQAAESASQEAKPKPTTARSPPPPPNDPDARDPVLAARLTSLGAVQPAPHYSPSSRSPLDPTLPTASPSRPSTHDAPDMPTSLPASAFPSAHTNPALRLLDARRRIAAAAEEELTHVGRRGFQGRMYLDAYAVRLALARRARGEGADRIEEAMGLRRGRLAVLGPSGVVEAVKINP